MTNGVLSQEDFATLRKEFASATDFSAFWNYFLDTWASRPDFLAMGGPAHTDELSAIVKHVGDKVYGRPTNPMGMKLIKIPEAKLAHGACLLEESMACVIYFEDLEMGLVTVTTNESKTHYARFTFKSAKSVKQ